MNKNLIRIVAFLLVPCLVADPSVAQLARPDVWRAPTASIHFSRPVFDQQALSVPAIFPHNAVQRIAFFVRRLLGHYDNFAYETVGGGTSHAFEVEGLERHASKPSFLSFFASQKLTRQQIRSARFKEEKRTGKKITPGEKLPPDGQKRRQFFKWLGGGAAVAGLGVGGWFVSSLWRKTPVPYQTPEQLASLRLYVGGLRAASLGLRSESPRLFAHARQIAEQTNDPTWASELNAFVDRVYNDLAHRPTYTEDQEAWLKPYNRLVDDLNRRVLIPRGWLFLPLTAQYLLIIGKIQEQEEGLATHTALDGKRDTLDLPIFTVESMALTDDSPPEVLAGANRMGPPEHSMLVVNGPAIDEDVEFHRQVLDPSSKASKLVTEDGVDWIRDAYVQALTKEGWVQNGTLSPDFSAADRLDSMLHESVHAFNASAALSQISRDEAFTHLTGLIDAKPYVRLVKLMLMAHTQMTEALKHGTPPLDLSRPFAHSEGILIAFTLARALGETQLAEDIAHFNTGVLPGLAQRLLSLDPAPLAAIAERARQEAGQGLPVHDGHFTLVLQNSPVPAASQKSVDPIETQAREAIGRVVQHLRQGWSHVPEVPEIIALAEKLLKNEQGFGIRVVDTLGGAGFAHVMDPPEWIIEIARDRSADLSSEEREAQMAHELFHWTQRQRARFNRRIQLRKEVPDLLILRSDENSRKFMETLSIEVENELEARNYDVGYRTAMARASNQTLEEFYNARMDKVAPVEASMYRGMLGYLINGRTLDQDRTRRLVFNQKFSRYIPLLKTIALRRQVSIASEDDFNRWLLSWLKDPTYYDSKSPAAASTTSGRTGGAWFKNPVYIKYFAQFETALIFWAPYLASLLGAHIPALLATSPYAALVYGFMFWAPHVIRAVQERDWKVLISRDVLLLTLMHVISASVIPFTGLSGILFHLNVITLTGLHWYRNQKSLRLQVNSAQASTYSYQPPTRRDFIWSLLGIAFSRFIFGFGTQAQKDFNEETAEMTGADLQRGLMIDFKTESAGLITISAEVPSAQGALGVTIENKGGAELTVTVDNPAYTLFQARVPARHQNRVLIPPHLSMFDPKDKIKLTIHFVPDTGGVLSLHDVNITVGIPEDNIDKKVSKRVTSGSDSASAGLVGMVPQGDAAQKLLRLLSGKDPASHKYTALGIMHHEAPKEEIFFIRDVLKAVWGALIELSDAEVSALAASETKLINFMLNHEVVGPALEKAQGLMVEAHGSVINIEHVMDVLYGRIKFDRTKFLRDLKEEEEILLRKLVAAESLFGTRGVLSVIAPKGKLADEWRDNKTDALKVAEQQSTLPHIKQNIDGTTNRTLVAVVPSTKKAKPITARVPEGFSAFPGKTFVAGPRVLLVQGRYTVTTETFKFTKGEYEKASILTDPVAPDLVTQRLLTGLLRTPSDPVESLRVLRSLVSFGAQHWWSFRAGPELTFYNQLKALARKLEKGIPKNSYQREKAIRDIVDGLQSLPREKLNERMGELLIRASDQLASFLKIYGNDVTDWSNARVEMVLNAGTPLAYNEETRVLQADFFTFLDYYDHKIAPLALEHVVNRMKLNRMPNVESADSALIDEIVLVRLDLDEVNNPHNSPDYRQKKLTEYLQQLNDRGVLDYSRLLKHLSGLSSDSLKTSVILQAIRNDRKWARRAGIPIDDFLDANVITQKVEDRLKAFKLSWRYGEKLQLIPLVPSRKGSAVVHSDLPLAALRPITDLTRNIPNPFTWTFLWRGVLIVVAVITLGYWGGQRPFKPFVDSIVRIFSDTSTKNSNVYEAGSRSVITYDQLENSLETYQPLTANGHLAESGESGALNHVSTFRNIIDVQLSGHSAPEMLMTDFANAIGDGGRFMQVGPIDFIPSNLVTNESTVFIVQIPPMSQGHAMRLPILLDGRVDTHSLSDSRYAVDAQGWLTATQTVGETTVVRFKIRKTLDNGSFQTEQPITPWMQNEFDHIPPLIRQELDEARSKSDYERASAVASVINKYLGYSATQKVQLREGTWMEFLGQVLENHDRFVSDSDVLDTLAFIFARYVHSEAVIVVGLNNKDDQSLVGRGRADASLVIRIGPKWLLFDPSDSSNVPQIFDEPPVALAQAPSAAPNEPSATPAPSNETGGSSLEPEPLIPSDYSAKTLGPEFEFFPSENPGSTDVNPLPPGLVDAPNAPTVYRVNPGESFDDAAEAIFSDRSYWYPGALYLAADNITSTLGNDVDRLRPGTVLLVRPHAEEWRTDEATAWERALLKTRGRAWYERRRDALQDALARERQRPSAYTQEVEDEIKRRAGKHWDLIKGDILQQADILHEIERAWGVKFERTDMSTIFSETLAISEQLLGETENQLRSPSHKQTPMQPKTAAPAVPLLEKPALAPTDSPLKMPEVDLELQTAGVKTLGPHAGMGSLAYAEIANGIIPELDVEMDIPNATATSNQGGYFQLFLREALWELQSAGGKLPAKSELKAHIASLFTRTDNQKPILIRVSKTLTGVTSVRCVNPITNQAEIILSKEFYDAVATDLMDSGGTHWQARYWLLAERLFHELGHSNSVGTLEKERAEERALILMDVALWQNVQANNQNLAWFINYYFESEKRVFPSGYYFKFLQELIQISRPEVRAARVDAYLKTHMTHAVTADTAKAMGARNPDTPAKSSKGELQDSSRRDFLTKGLWSAGLAGVSVALGCRTQTLTTEQATPVDIQKTWDIYLASKKVPITFQPLRDYHQGDIAVLLRTLITFQSETLTQGKKIGGFSVEKAQGPQAVYDLERKTWAALQQSITDPALRPVLAAPYSHEAFNHFILFTVPPYVANYGLFSFHPQMLYADDKGMADYLGFPPEFFEISDIQQPDFGPELGASLEKLGAHITQRLIVDKQVSSDLQAVEANTDWDGKSYYGTIAYNRKWIDSESEPILDLMEEMLERFGVKLGQGRGIQASFAFPGQLESVTRGESTPLQQSQHNAVIYWLSRTQIDIEQGMASGGDPLRLIEERLKTQADRHEGTHYLDDLDPEQTIHKAITHSRGGTVSENLAGDFNELVHHEINGQIGELRYGIPAEALRALIQSTLVTAQDENGQVGSENEHTIAWNWIYEKILDLLEQGWAPRFGMEYIASNPTPRRDQILIQLYRLGMPDNENTLHALMDAVKSEHVKDYGRKFIRKPTEPPVSYFDTWYHWVPIIFGIAAAILLVVQAVRRRFNNPAASGKKSSGKSYAKNQKSKSNRKPKGSNSGSWFGGLRSFPRFARFYTRYIAWLETPLVLFVVGRYLPVEYHSISWLVYALAFYLPHVFGNRRALKSPWVIILAITTGVVGYFAGPAHLFSPLVFSLTAVHLVMNLFYRQLHQLPVKISILTEPEKFSAIYKTLEEVRQDEDPRLQMLSAHRLDQRILPPGELAEYLNQEGLDDSIEMMLNVLSGKDSRKPLAVFVAYDRKGQVAGARILTQPAEVAGSNLFGVQGADFVVTRYQHRGVGEKLLRASVEWLFQDKQTPLIADIADNKPRSASLFLWIIKSMGLTAKPVRDPKYLATWYEVDLSGRFESQLSETPKLDWQLKLIFATIGFIFLGFIAIIAGYFIHYGINSTMPFSQYLLGRPVDQAFPHSFGFYYILQKVVLLTASSFVLGFGVQELFKHKQKTGKSYAELKEDSDNAYSDLLQLANQDPDLPKNLYLIDKYVKHSEKGLDLIEQHFGRGPYLTYAIALKELEQRKKLLKTTALSGLGTVSIGILAGLTAHLRYPVAHSDIKLLGAALGTLASMTLIGKHIFREKKWPNMGPLWLRLSFIGLIWAGLISWYAGWLDPLLGMLHISMSASQVIHPVMGGLLFVPRGLDSLFIRFKQSSKNPLRHSEFLHAA